MDPAALESCRKAEECEEFSGDAASLHPYHYKIFHMYMKHLDEVLEMAEMRMIMFFFLGFYCWFCFGLALL